MYGFADVVQVVVQWHIRQLLADCCQYSMDLVKSRETAKNTVPCQDQEVLLKLGLQAYWPLTDAVAPKVAYMVIANICRGQ